MGSFVARTCVVPAGERRRRWKMGQLDGHWYCLDCWAEYTDRPVEEMPEYLGWAVRDAKRTQHQQHQQRAPHRIGRDDDRSSNPSLQTRLISCDFRGCMKPCRGVGSGCFVTETLPACAERRALWENESLDMTFYCQRYYERSRGGGCAGKSPITAAPQH